jgi:hypothetical protein
MVNFTKERSIFFFSRGITRDSYLFVFVTESTIDQPPFDLGVLSPHNSGLHVIPLQKTCQNRGIPIRLNGMTVSYFESVKS